MDEFDSVFDYQLDDDFDQQLADAMEADAEERADNDLLNNNFDAALENTENAKDIGELTADDSKRKQSEFAHNLAAGLEREKIAFSHHPFRWIADKIRGAIIFVATLAGDAFRSALFGYSRPFDWQNMQERQREQDIMEKAQKDGKDGNTVQEQDENTKERESDDLAGQEDAVKRAQHDIEQQGVDKMKASVERSNVFMNAVGMTSMYDTDKKELNIFAGGDKHTFDMSQFDDNLTKAMENETEHTLETVGSGLANSIQQNLQSDTPTSVGVLTGLMCSAVIIGHQLDLNSSSPLSSKFSETLASCELPDGKQVSIVADRLFENNSGGPQASINLKCMYDGKMFAKMPLSALSNKKAINQSVFEEIKDALLTVMENPETRIVYEIEEPEAENKISNDKESTQKSINQLLDQVDNPDKNDVPIQTINKEMEGNVLSCVGQITDLKVKTRENGTICKFKLQGDSGETIKCYCNPNAYNDLQNMIHEGEEKVRIKALVSCGNYNGKETIELKPQSIVLAEEISTERSFTPETGQEVNPFAKGEEHGESKDDTENRIFDDEYDDDHGISVDELTNALRDELQNEPEELGELR